MGGKAGGERAAVWDRLAASEARADATSSTSSDSLVSEEEAKSPKGQKAKRPTMGESRLAVKAKAEKEHCPMLVQYATPARGIRENMPP